MLVFISHLPLDWPYSVYFTIGRIGVAIFFLMSGYLTVSAREKRNRKQYLLNRLARIYPMYWILLILMCFVKTDTGLSLQRIVANFTAFQEFLGFENIIGASWMLPIQITFFIGVCIFGIRFITGKGQTAQRHIILILVMIMSVLVGALRFYTGKPFPTAFCLLIAVALLGINYTDYDKGSISRTDMIALIVEFEVGLVIAVVLSYTDMIFEYLFAYNVGLLMFFVAKGINVYNKFFIKLGEIGFVFFLGAGIPYELITKFITFDSSLPMQIIGCLIKFVLAYGFAFLLTRYVEKPILAQVRKLENGLK
ncbi:MAG: acyltransferase family protein [Lachnospiraceae bacterium]|nr:acyltransferase family protein [Lachnospiraceae bacterium]